MKLDAFDSAQPSETAQLGNRRLFFAAQASATIARRDARSLAPRSSVSPITKDGVPLSFSLSAKAEFLRIISSIS